MVLWTLALLAEGFKTKIETPVSQIYICCMCHTETGYVWHKDFSDTHLEQHK